MKRVNVCPICKRPVKTVTNLNRGEMTVEIAGQKKVYPAMSLTIFMPCGHTKGSRNQ